jgi:hypothetical protein
MPRIDPSTESTGRRIAASASASTGHLLTVYEGGDWSVWPAANVFNVVPAPELAALGIAPDVDPPPPNGMRLYIARGSNVARMATKGLARAELALGNGRYLVALNANLTLCSVTPPGAPKALTDNVIAAAQQETGFNGRSR